MVVTKAPHITVRSSSVVAAVVGSAAVVGRGRRWRVGVVLSARSSSPSVVAVSPTVGGVVLAQDASPDGGAGPFLDGDDELAGPAAPDGEVLKNNLWNN